MGFLLIISNSVISRSNNEKMHYNRTNSMMITLTFLFCIWSYISLSSFEFSLSSKILGVISVPEAWKGKKT